MKSKVIYQLYISAISLYRTFLFPFIKWKNAIAGRCIYGIGAYSDRKTILEGDNYIGRNSFVSEVALGRGTYISDDCFLAKTQIGRFSSIGVGVITAIGEHPIKKGFSSSPSFYSVEPINRLSLWVDKTVDEYKYCNDEYCISIGNDVWIGSRVVLNSGITIGNGAVVGSGSVVIKDLEPYGIYVGSPAKLIGYRFDEDKKNSLIRSEWWNKSNEWIIENMVSKYCK